VIAVAAALLVLAGTAVPAPLPADGEVAGLRRDGAGELFRGAELYGHIDGGAELYLEFGFDELTVRRYAGDGSALEAELYRMSDADAALGVYLSRCGRETPDAALAARHTVGRLQLLLVRERYLLVLTGDPERPPARAVLLTFAGAVTDQLPPPAAVAAAGWLPATGRREGSLRLARGPVALQAIVELGEGDVLSLAGRLTAAAASYDDDAGGVSTRVAVEYPDQASAAAALAHLRAALGPGLEVVGGDERRLELRDRSGRPGGVVLDGCRLAVTLGRAVTP
jgi:hypothetical protein